MDFLGDGLRRAVQLFLSTDAEVYGIVFLTLKVALVATVAACGLGLPAREARFALAAVITAAFGHVVAEIGSCREAP